MDPVRLGYVPTYRFGFTPWVQKMRDDGLAALKALSGVEIFAPQDGAIDPENGCVPHGAVNTLDQGEALAEYYINRRVDGLVIVPLDFGDERSALKVAERVGKPVLLYATKEPPANDDLGLTRVSDSYCGNLSISSGLYRRKIAFRYAGIFFPGEPELQTELVDFARALSVVKALKNARIGQIGVRPSAFETVGYDEVAMIEKFGQNVIHTELSEITGRALSYSENDPEVKKIMAAIRAGAPIITVSDQYVLNAARIEKALLDFAAQNRITALAMQCWPSVQKLIPIQLCGIYGRLTGQGLPAACETDILGALSMLASYSAAMGQTVPHFIDWTIQHREDPNKLLAWHCGNAPASLAADPSCVAIRSREDQKRVAPPDSTATQAIDPQEGLYQFQLKAGEVTICRLAEYDNCWKMLITRGEIVPSDETLAGTWSWVQVADHAKLYRTLVEEGFIHHASLIHGDQSAALVQACKYLGITPVVV